MSDAEVVLVVAGLATFAWICSVVFALERRLMAAWDEEAVGEGEE